MATPNQMPKRPNKLRQQIVSNLIDTRPSSWTKKRIVKDKDGKEQVESVKVTHSELRHSFAQNMSDANVERLAERWL